ncbi:hypothetical protein QYF36_014035 [Acer negundo]|nr:hypothetical protein QYF36_014035 [Acer negundo]
MWSSIRGAAVVDMVADTLRRRVVWWFKNCGPGSPMSPSTMMLNLNIGCVDVVKNQRRLVTRWCPPTEGVLKFNVDGSSRGNPGPAGIGGILCNNVGDSICMFSSFLGDGFSSAASEISANLKACELCDSNNCPAGILEIRDFLRSNGPKVLVRFVPRSSNVAADLLAKLGVLSGLAQVIWRS